MNLLEKRAYIELNAMRLGEMLANTKIANMGMPMAGNVMKNLPATGSTGSTILSRLKGQGSHIAELAGLGILAAPSVAHMTGHDMGENTNHAMELGGLGVLAAPSALHLGKAILNRH
jgi:hypothetical protein